MQERTEHVGRFASTTIGSEPAGLSRTVSLDPAALALPVRRRADHGVTIARVIAGPGRAGAHVALCLCGFAGGEHDERRQAAAEGREHVEAEQPIPFVAHGGALAWLASRTRRGATRACASRILSADGTTPTGHGGTFTATTSASVCSLRAAMTTRVRGEPKALLTVRNLTFVKPDGSPVEATVHLNLAETVRLVGFLSDHVELLKIQARKAGHDV